MVVVLSGVPVLVVLNEKHEVSDRVRSVSAKLLIPMMEVVFMEPTYSSICSPARWVNA
jgi:hypothetical protein